MKITCDIIGDLLPLYAEELTSADSAALVEEHLTGCEHCRKTLESLKTGAVSLPEETIPLKKVQISIKKRRWATALLAVSLALAVVFNALSFLTAPIYLPYDESIIRITEEDGTLYLSFPAEGNDPYVTDCSLEWGSDDEGSPTNDLFLMAWYTRLDRMRNRRMASTVLGDDLRRIHYTCPDETGETTTTCIWSAEDGDSSGGVIVLPRMVLSFYFLLAGFAAAALLVAWLLLRKTKAAPIFRGVFSLLVCYLIAHFCVKGGTSLTCWAERDFAFIVGIALCYWGIVLSGGWLIRQKR